MSEAKKIQLTDPGRDRGHLANQMPPVQPRSEEELQHARCVVVERIFGLGGLTAMDEPYPAEAAMDIMGALGILPGQPPPRDTLKWGQLKKLHATAKANRPEADARTAGRVQKLGTVNLDGENSGLIDPIG